MTPAPNYRLDTTEEDNKIMENMESKIGLIENIKPTDPVADPMCGSYRLFVVLCGSLVMVTSFASQASMTSAMVCMINDVNDNNSRAMTNHTGLDFHTTVSTHYNEPIEEAWKFSWDSETQGWIVSSFFFGYYFMQLPSGVLVTRLGPKSSMVFGLFTTAILHLISVPVASWSLPALYIVRTLAGLTSGCLLAGTFALTANWCPRQETSMMFSIASMGLEFGNSFIFLVSLFACEMSFQGGWPIIFYTLGTFQLILGTVVAFAVTNYPNTNRCISAREAKYIEKTRASENRVHSIPYGKIMRSVPVWGSIVAQFSFEYVYYTIVTQGPLFLRDILKLPHWQSNMISSIPFMVVTPLAFLTGYISDKLIINQTFSTTCMRKINETVSKILLGVPLAILPFVQEGAWIQVLFIYMFAASGIPFSYSGYMANPGDLSPAHTGFLAALGQALTAWVAFVIPVLTGQLTKEKTREGWYVIFYIAVGLDIFCLIFYQICGSGDLQPWATTPDAGEETPILNKRGKNGAITNPRYDAVDLQDETPS